MADVFSTAKRSAVMATIRSRGNRDTELKLAAILHAHGLTGWRRHQPLPGTPRKSVQQLTEAALSMLASLEALPPEQWAGMDEGQRKNTYETIEMLREQRADMLAELPIERRRHWKKS